MAAQSKNKHEWFAESVTNQSIHLLFVILYPMAYTSPNPLDSQVGETHHHWKKTEEPLNLLQETRF